MDTKTSHSFSEFKKTKDFLLCVDSDGCVMDTMDIKHKKCFGPCFVAEWQLEKYNDEMLERWNEINLYSMDRGINRYKGLEIILNEIYKINLLFLKLLLIISLQVFYNLVFYQQPKLH